MNKPVFKMLDGNEAVAWSAYKTNEVCAIYPITPASPMGEFADAWAAAGMKNLWNTVPSVVELQSEGGASGTIHGALQSGALSSTFTASQGLLLMLPNMYKIAGELTPTVFHIAARSLAAQALSIFGDHSDVMSARMTGWAMLCSNSVQESHDLAFIAQAATLKAKLPFLHFFDGFRTSHEVAKVTIIPDETMLEMIDEDKIADFRSRKLSPDHPVIRGTAQNPDVYFQARETVNPFYDACPAIVQEVMDEFAKLTGRAYKLFDYVGAEDADKVVIMMGSGAETADETVEYLMGKGEKVGLLKVRLYRPFDAKALLAALPKTAKSIGVLDRTKEPGAGGDPLMLDVVHALHEAQAEGVLPFAQMPKVVAGRYGLSSKEFTPGMVKGIFDNLGQDKPKNRFTIGINDDVSHSSLEFGNLSTLGDDVFEAFFYGLGSDGTVGANKDSIKIIGENTDNYAQGYFVYDSKKSGAVTVSHLRFGPKPIRSSYLIEKAKFIGCHQPFLVERYDMISKIEEGGTFLLSTPYSKDEIWDKLPADVQNLMIEKKVKFYVINATEVAQSTGMGGRINTIMQACFFSVSGVLPAEEAMVAIKDSIRKTYGRKGEEIVNMNINAVEKSVDALYQVDVPAAATSTLAMRAPVTHDAPPFVKDVLGKIIEFRGDDLPVSALPNDGTYPTATAKYEKRDLTLDIPVWDEEVCIQCGRCVFVCPHACIRAKVYDPALLEKAPTGFKSRDARMPAWKGMKYSLQVAPEDCTGCGICVDICPAKNKSQAKLKAINMAPQPPLRDKERTNWDFFLTIPEMDRAKVDSSKVREQQIQQPLFEFSGACAGCGETPYVKLMSQLFGDRMIVANATGCSSIYGGNLPTTPWAQDNHGRGPAWSNSLFEDNAEFGLGFRVSIDKQKEFAREMLTGMADDLGKEFAYEILGAEQDDEAGISAQRERVKALKGKLETLATPAAKRLLAVADMLVKKSVWILGGDGWAYDIGYGGLDHVLASGWDVNILVLDTEVYSNTGGQMSKATPIGAVAKFAAGGKPVGKKDLGLIAMSYGNVYVASVAMGAKDEHTLKAFRDAEAHKGVSIIIAYSHCIAHGINMTTGLKNQKAAVESGQWLLYRFDPSLAIQGKNPLQLDSNAPKMSVEEYMRMENRFKMLTKSKPEVARKLFNEAQENANARWEFYKYLAAREIEAKDTRSILEQMKPESN